MTAPLSYYAELFCDQLRFTVEASTLIPFSPSSLFVFSFLILTTASKLKKKTNNLYFIEDLPI